MPTLKLRARTPNLGRFGGLLAALLLTFATGPFFTDEARGASEISVLYTVVVLAGAYAVSRRRRVFWIGLALAGPALSLEWISNFVYAPALVFGNLLLMGLFVAYVACVVIYEVLDEQRVTIDTIAGGIAAYLLVGLGWVLVYAAIEFAEPGSFLVRGQTFRELHPELQVRFPEFLYFSFVTLTTLGFGDIVPTSAPARGTTAGEAIVGQLYIAIFVARLVGLHLAHQVQARRD